MFFPTGRSTKEELSWSLNGWESSVAEADARVQQNLQLQRERPIITNWKAVREGAKPKFVWGEIKSFKMA